MKNRWSFLVMLIAASMPYGLAAQGTFGQNLVQNGSFEVNYDYSGWILASGALVNLGGPGGGVQCAEGKNAVGLSWQSSLYQDVPTVVGQQYDFSFYLADWGPNSVPANVVSLIASFGSNPLGTATFSGAGHTYQNMGWQRFDYTVTATSTTSRIMFFNPGLVNTDTVWPMVDNVGLASVPEPTGALLVLSGIVTLLRCRRTLKGVLLRSAPQ